MNMHGCSLHYRTDQSRNLNYEQVFFYMTKHNKWILNSIGIWPAVLLGIGKYLPNIAIVISNLILSFTLLQCILHIVFEQKNPLLRLKILGLTAFSFISMLKYWALTLRKNKIKRCIEQLRTDWKQVELREDRDLMLRYGKIGRNLSVSSVVFIGLLDVQKSPVYELVYVLQCVCGYVFDTVTASVCGLAALFVTHACGQIDIVMARLNDLVDGKLAREISNPHTRLMEIVERHMKVLRFSTTVEAVLSEVCFLEFVGTTFVICLLEFYCLTDWRQNDIISLITYTLLLISLTFNIFLLCYISDLLIEKSTNVGKSCCMIDWYELPNSTIRGLILIIAISKNPAKITAGNIADLSLSTFANILKTSFAYLNFLQTATV
ncbi:LOW QUALITY PROTEIN: odorant receptor 13a-like [Ceratina calcarata]|uniref:Odorant receptor n=1 Tax=Ceratina calcarata TaxID=156304 RepID=A0AAJ7S1C1_9HYME|nr:LOW QUALITY PROTEIN: odorant receptor 13a-like [Ceratina calcarata]